MLSGLELGSPRYMLLGSSRIISANKVTETTSVDKPNNAQKRKASSGISSGITLIGILAKSIVPSRKPTNPEIIHKGNCTTRETITAAN